MREKCFRWILLILLLAPASFADAPTLSADDIFHSDSSVISLTYTQRIMNLEQNQEVLADYSAARKPSGLSFRADYHLESPVTQMLLFYPDADPFLLRYTLVPSKKLCYQNQFTKKDYTFDPHTIQAAGLWHSLLDGLDQLKKSGLPLNVIGEETIAGLSCKKVTAGDITKDGFLVWYSPKVDLLLKIEVYKAGKVASRKEVTVLKEGELPADTFVLPKNCPMQTLTNKEFDALDVQKLGKKE